MILPWACGECGHRNPSIRGQCRVCGADRKFKTAASLAITAEGVL